MKTCQVENSARFLKAEMSDLEVAAFEDHLESCPACRERLESEAGGEDAWSSARKLLCFASGSPIWSSRPGDQETERHLSGTTSLLMAILAPSDDPAMVGRIGSYEIMGLIGRGSAGIVLKGFDRALSRNVAIKVLDPALADLGAARQRFAREARAMAAISHEHVVPVYEVSEHAGLPYFVMEYVPGGSLDRRLHAEGPLDTLSVVRVGLQVAQALTEAHAQGLVHRDIKPGNILLDRGTERVRVADFGLVHAVNDASCTRSGFVAGTPQYMAPEQVRGETCDGRSDLFSLGAVMFTLCTGHPPFRAETVYGVMQQVVRESPMSIRKAHPGVPAWLEAFILRLLAKDRADRFDSAQTVAQLLQAELAHLQNARNVEAPRRTWLASSRKRPGAWQIAVALVAVLGLSIAAVTTGIWLRNWGQKEQAASPPGVAPQQSVGDSGVTGAAESVIVPPWEDDLDDVASRLNRFQERAERAWDTFPVTNSREPESSGDLSTEGVDQ